MVPAYGNIQNCGMISLMRAIPTNAGEALGDDAYNSLRALAEGTCLCVHLDDITGVVQHADNCPL